MEVPQKPTKKKRRREVETKEERVLCVYCGQWVMITDILHIKCYFRRFPNDYLFVRDIPRSNVQGRDALIIFEIFFVNIS